MKTALRLSLLSIGAIAVVAAASCDEYLGNINEGLNIHDMGGKIVIPYAVANSAFVGGIANIGPIYIGVFSGLDSRLGFLSPVAAPASVSGGDTFPYGGTTIGDFQTQDFRYVCIDVLHRTIKDTGTAYEMDFSVLQFPFYPGSVVWAFADTFAGSPAPSYSTCNPNLGNFDEFRFPIKIASVAPGSAADRYQVTFDPTDLSPIYTVNSGSISLAYPRLTKAQGGPDPGAQLVDGAARVFDIVSVLSTSQAIVEVKDFYHYNTAPNGGGNLDQLIIEANLGETYGSQNQDILNHPVNYLHDHDLTVSTTTTLASPQTVTLTLDHVIHELGN